MSKKPRVRKKLFTSGRNFYSDPYYDDYINFECPSCRKIIHYGYEKCPECGAEIDQNHPNVNQARKRSRQELIVSVLLCLIAAAFVIFIIVDSIIN